MSFDLNFNVDEAPSLKFEPLKGDFLAEVIEAETKGDRNKGGVKLCWELLQGRPGLKVREYFNLFHPSDKAQEIGNAQFGKRCKDLGINGVVKSSDELIGKRAILRLATEASKEIDPNTGEPYQNVVVKNSWHKDSGPKRAAAAAAPAHKPIEEEYGVSDDAHDIDSDEVPF